MEKMAEELGKTSAGMQQENTSREEAVAKEVEQRKMMDEETARRVEETAKRIEESAARAEEKRKLAEEEATKRVERMANALAANAEVGKGGGGSSGEFIRWGSQEHSLGKDGDGENRGEEPESPVHKAGQQTASGKARLGGADA